MYQPLENEVADILVLGQTSSIRCGAFTKLGNEGSPALVVDVQAPRLAEEFKGIRLEIDFYGPTPITEDTVDLVFRLIKPHVVGNW